MTSMLYVCRRVRDYTRMQAANCFAFSGRTNGVHGAVDKLRFSISNENSVLVLM